MRVKEVVSVARKQVEGTRFIFGYIGGFSLGLERAGMQTVCFCECDPFCQKVLNKNFPGVPVHGDIKTFHWPIANTKYKGCIGGSGGSDTDGNGIQEGEQTGCESRSAATRRNEINIDLICGGFPCQPFSCAGKRRGTNDDRFLWPGMLRIIKEVRPTWVIGENVAGIKSIFQYESTSPMEGRQFISKEEAEACFEGMCEREGRNVLDMVVGELEEIGYEVQPFLIPACAVNAPHRRDRFWIIANNTGARLDGSASNGPTRTDSHAADTKHTTTTRYGQDSRGILSVTEPIRLNNCNQWDENWYTVATRTCVRGIHDGVPRGMDRVNRLKALGNAIVPQIAEIIGRAIMEVENS